MTTARNHASHRKIAAVNIHSRCVATVRPDSAILNPCYGTIIIFIILSFDLFPRATI